MEAKLWATSMDHPECGVVNHCLPVFLPPLLVTIIAFLFGFLAGILEQPWMAQLATPFNFISYCCLLYIATLIRLNMRRKHGIGNPAFQCPDCLCVFCCAPCALCQELRSVDKAGWDWLAQVRATGVQTSTGSITLAPRPASSFGGPTSPLMGE